MKKSAFNILCICPVATLLIFALNSCNQRQSLVNPFGANVPCTKHLNINYAGGTNPLQSFDLYVPQVSLPGNAPKSLVVFIHGGGFVSGDKQDNKDPTKANKEVAALLNNKIAFASINYQLVQNNDAVGIKKCLDDSKMCLDYIRANSTSYGLNPDKFALWGSSAGSGLCMLIGFDVPSTPNFVKAIYADVPQATYDIEKWVSVVFPPSYCTEQQICNVLNAPPPAISAHYVRSIYGLGAGNNDWLVDIKSPSQPIREDCDILLKIDNVNDPPIWIENNNPNNNDPLPPWPITKELLNHHVVHATALKNQAAGQIEYFYQVNNGTIESSLAINPYSNVLQFLKSKLQ